MENKFIALAVGLTVGVIMLSSFLWPLVSDATATDTTFKNEGYLNAEVIDPSKTYTIAWDPANQYVVNINDIAYDLSSAQTSEYSGFSIAFTDSWIMRYNLDRMFICPLDAANAGVVSLATVENGYSFEATLSDNTLTTVVNGATNTYSASGTGLIVSEKGEYVLKSANAEAYVSDTSNIYCAGRTNRAYSSIAGTAFNLYMVATINNVTSHYAPNAWTVSNETADAVEVANYVGLYKVSKVTATVNDGTNGDTTITYNQIFVPAEVTAEKAQHLDTTQIALVAAIGTLGAIVLIAAAAGSIRRLD